MCNFVLDFLAIPLIIEVQKWYNVKMHENLCTFLLNFYNLDLEDAFFYRKKVDFQGIGRVIWSGIPGLNFQDLLCHLGWEMS